VAAGTVRFDGTFPKSLVASRTLPVKGVTAFGDIFIALVRVVAFAAGLGIVILVFGECVVTVPAVQAIALHSRMGLMIEEDIARSHLKHHAHRLPRGPLGRERSIAESAYDQQYDSQTVNQLKLFFRKHVDSNLLVVKESVRACEKPCTDYHNVIRLSSNFWHPRPRPGACGGCQKITISGTLFLAACTYRAFPFSEQSDDVTGYHWFIMS
jgi:hypothetical protein